MHGTGQVEIGQAGASMGPRSENRGYGLAFLAHVPAVVASMGPRSENRGYAGLALARFQPHWPASMGPRSENRGYAFPSAEQVAEQIRLQWVHGPRTVVMHAPSVYCSGAWLASMGPRSENRGYVAEVANGLVATLGASMGPRSENRGYAPAA